MTPNERELLRLQVLLSKWPSGAGRAEFKTELHLKGVLEEAYKKVFSKTQCPHCRGTGEVGGIIDR